MVRDISGVRLGLVGLEVVVTIPCDRFYNTSKYAQKEFGAGSNKSAL